ncbi:hypothetical protein Vretimale_16682 [Volvox reticuliferus]|uniref:Transmembrane protein n=1 Tax=Volvox reticuliferus TaxID=1737510 RepID=A0A8J4GRR0_9CHLO|nr:hypothetical protein Vretifemale_8529 [Volvox reticuliferus]GIM13616.1 hypothetical protein Vretimale_16682 [Volvox reticuliferus]
MQGIRVNICDHRPGLDFFADWIASETHFGTPAITDTSATCEHLRLRGTLPAIPRNPRTYLARTQVPSPQTQSPQTQASNAQSFTESGTQTEHQASITASQTQAFGQFPHSGNPAITASANTALGQAVPARASAAASPAAKDVSPPAIEQAPSSTPLAEPATPPEALEPPSVVVSPPVGADDSIDPTAASGPQIPSHSSSASRGPRSRTQVGRSSYELLWREYLALTAEDHYQQQQQRAAGHRCTRRSLAVGSNNNDSTTINNTASRRITDMAARAPSTVVQGPMSYDQPKGLDMLFLQLLCPPTDFLDVQKLTKLLIRIVIAASLWMFTMSFAILPAWLWLLRHELMQGHNGDCAVVLVLGLIIVLLSDWVRVAVDRADSARCAGVFTASTRSAYQLSPAIRTSSITTGQSAAVGKPAVGAGGPASHASALANPAGGAVAGGGLLPSASRSQPSRAVNASSVVPVDPLVRQVKQRIIRLEHILFGNELTEADISRDALSSRVQMLCTEVGVPFGGPGGSSSSRPNVAELDQQLRAVESALGVIQ